MKTIAALTVFAALLGIAGPVAADPVGGPISGTSRVQANAVNVHTVMYRGGEQADFRVTGDGDTTLNLVVRDGLGNVVVRTSGPGDRAHVTWRPSATANYYISVINSGSVYNQYSYRAY